MVVCHERTECRALGLRLTWKTTGEGNPQEGEPVERDLFSGTWEEGKEYRYPIDLVVPPGPPTSAGSLLGVQWAIRATARYAWIGRIEVTSSLVVIPGPKGNAAIHGPEYSEPEEALQGEAQMVGCGSVIAAVLILGGAAILFRADRIESCMGIPFGVALIVGGVIVLWKLLKRGVAAKKLGHPEVHVSSGTAAPGESVTVRLRLVPRARVHLGPISLQLKGEAKTVKGAGKSTTTREESLTDAPAVVLSPGRPLEKEEAWDLQGEIRVPSSARATLVIRDNRIVWWITVRVPVDGWPDWERNFPLTILPPGCSPAAPPPDP